MKVQLISDTHGYHKYVNVDASVDMIVHSGDSTNYYDLIKNEIEFRDFIDWFSKLPIKHKVLIAGNHDCNHKDTEYLTEKGWLKFNDIDNIKLAQFEKDKILYEYPLEKIKGFSKNMILIEGLQTKQVVTENHDVIIDNIKVKAKDLINKRVKERSVQISGKSDFVEINIPNKIIKLLTWIVCDGTLVNYKTKSGDILTKRIQFKLSKKEKIENIKKLLESLNIKYTLRPCKKEKIQKIQPYYICIYTKEARKITKYFNNTEKQFPTSFMYLNKNQVSFLIEGLLETDASEDKSGGVTLNSINRKDLDILQYIFVNNNIDSVVSKTNNKSGFPNGKVQYRLRFWYKRKCKRDRYLKIKKIEYNDFHYCFKMPKGNLITRFQGKVSFTGNCWATKNYNKNFVKDQGIIYLEDDYTEVEGKLLFGSPWSPTFGNWHFMKSREKLGRFWDNVLQEGIDLLITHSPPKGILDLTYDFNNSLKFCGCNGLLKAISKYKPKHHVFGHIHNNSDIVNFGTRVIEDTKFYNASFVKDGYFDSIGTFNSNGIIIEV